MALVIAASLTVCGSNNDTIPIGSVGTNNEVSLDKELVLIDNENVTIPATAKFEEVGGALRSPYFFSQSPTPVWMTLPIFHSKATRLAASSRSSGVW